MDNLEGLDILRSDETPDDFLPDALITELDNKTLNATAPLTTEYCPADVRWPSPADSCHIEPDARRTHESGSPFNPISNLCDTCNKNIENSSELCQPDCQKDIIDHALCDDCNNDASRPAAVSSSTLLSKTTSLTSLADAVDADLQCGFSSNLKAPQCLQKLATKRIFLFIFCLASVLQGMYYTYFVSVLTTIEKLFQIGSKTTGIIMSATEIGQIAGGLLLSYYGGRGHRPKWIACGMLIFACSSFLCALPHFLYGNDLLQEYLSIAPSKESPLTTANLCSLPTMTADADDDRHNSSLNNSSITEDQNCSTSSASSVVLQIFFVALLGVGVGQTAVYNLGIPYIDDNVGSRESPSYFGTTIGVRIFGPTLGFVLGAFCTSSYIDPLTDPGYDATDPRWIGAWWLGLLIISFCLIIVSLFMMMFPKRLPKKILMPHAKEEKPSINNRHISDNSNYEKVKVLTSSYNPPEHYKRSPTADVPTHLVETSIKTNSPDLNNYFYTQNVDEHNGSKALLGPSSPTNHLLEPANGNACQSAVSKHGSDKSFYSLPNKVLSCCSRRSFCRSKRKEVLREDQKHMKSPVTDQRTFRDFLRVTCRLLRNKVLLLRTASSVLHLLPITGLYTFLPKYLETQFRLTVYSAAIISGTGGIFVMGFGIFFSGFVIRRLNPSPRVIAAWIALTAFLYSFGMVILMFLGCSEVHIKGLVQANSTTSLSPHCGMSCGGCDSSIFAPICSSEGETYFSACHAGCSSVILHNVTEELMFSDCECLGSGVTASLSLCDTNCSNLPWYIVVFCIFVVIHSTSEVGGMMLTLRCVSPQDKAMALGLISVAIGLFGNVPCPIIYGSVVDSACILWRKTCTEQGACQMYNIDTFRHFFHGTTAALMMLAFFVDLMVWCCSNEISFDEEIPSPSAQDGKLTSFPTETTLQTLLNSSPRNNETVDDYFAPRDNIESKCNESIAENDTSIKLLDPQVDLDCLKSNQPLDRESII